MGLHPGWKYNFKIHTADSWIIGSTKLANVMRNVITALLCSVCLVSVSCLVSAAVSFTHIIIKTPDLL